MLEPNDSEINVDNAEDACKSDYFSDEGELKNDVPNTENGSSGKRKPTDIGPDEAKKVKVAADGITTLDKTAKLQSGISSNDFKRASSVASDNSDEFVDASDVLEPTSVADKTQTVTDDVDACAMKLSASSDAPKCVFESGSPKVKDKKFISRLPTFADDPLDHFNSSAIRRGFKEAEPTKPIDFNFDLSPSEKIEGKNENKTVRKVKLNRSKFFSNDKPKFSDDSSSDSNSKFNNSTSPVKTDVAPTIDNKVVPSAKVENRIAQPSVEEKPSVADELPSVSPNIVEIPKSDVESISKNEPENIPVSTENQNHSINAENTSTEPASSSYAEQKIQDETPEDQSALQIEQESEEVPEAVDTSLAPGEILDSNLDQTETEELTFEIDDLMEESFIDPISKTNDVDQEVNELPTDDNEPVPNEQIESEFESVVSELEFSSIEPETRAIDEPESLPIESEPRPDEPEPIQSDELSSPQQTKSPVLPTIENELLEQPNDQIEEIEDYVLSFNEDSLPASVESERAFISESIALQATTNSENPVPEIAEFGSTPGDEFIDLREDTQPEPESIQEPVVSEIISEPENVESERPSQNTDFDLTIESEDLADDKTEPYLSNEESEGEIEEEEEEEIHEEELYLEDRVPIVTKPNDPSPPPVLIPSPPAIKETEDVEEIIDDEREIVAQSADQVKFDSESAEQSVEPSPSLENIDDLAVEEETRRSPSVDDIETILPEQEFQNTPLSEDTEDIPTEPTIQRTPSFEDVADTPAEQTVQRIPSLENVTDIPAEEAVRRTPSLEDVTDIPVERAIERSPSFENIADISVDQSVRRTSSLEDIENIPMDIDEEPESTVPLPIPQGLSRLEQALIGKTGVKKLEIQVPLEECPVPFEIVNERASSTSADSEETKEKIKLHLSLQGDKVSIKKSPNTLVSSTSEVKARRPYRKRNKDGNLKPDKTYKLRTRSSKKDNAPAPENGQNKPVATTAVDDVIDLDADTSSKDDRIYSAEPILIDSDDSSKSGPVKIQPIKLKITKNSNVTIENASMYSDADKNRDFSEDTRKKDSIPNLMEQAATAWSGPDLQRVERLLKESNITITPVLPKESIIPQSILKPMLAAGKAKASTASKPCAPSITSTVSSSQSSSSDITPVSRDRYDDSSSGHTSPRSVDHQNGESVDHHQYRDGYDTSPSATDKQIDIKSEIRKMLASSDKRKLEPRDSTDMESDSSDSKSKSKYVPDLVPINLPTPEMLQSLATSLGTNTAAEGDPLADTSKPNIDPAFLPLLQAFPKKRGRPTKAMVAAREALKQSQEVALENLKQLATQKASEGQHIPILDITDPEDLFKTAKRGRKSRGERVDKSSDAEQSASEMTIDPEREAEEMKRLEEERIKKEEEKERRNEIRRQKARERNDLVKAKRLRQKMKAEERQKRMQEKRRKLQEEKKKLEEEIKNLPTSMPGFDDETRMSAENSQSQMISFSTGMGDEDSSNATTEFSQRVKKSRMEVTDIDSKDLTVDQIAEYQWPIQGGDLYMIQEQVSNYLGVKSFKRKYPDIKRRPVDSEERAYLVDSGLVSETLCDLGLTAVSSAELLDIMCADFPDKYEELRRYMREKQMKELSFKQKAWANGLGYKLLMADGTKQDLKKRAMESASNWNSALNKSRSDDRRCAIDLQTFIVHYPKNRARKMTIPTPKMGSYPVSILPGQFCDFYKNYTSTELRYMPINTVMYGPLKAHAAAPGDGSQTDSDDSSSSDESSTTSEGTQNTEDTIEDTDKDMSVDESSLLDKSHDLNLLKEQMTMELSENTRELIMDEAAKILCKVCLGNITRNKENVPEVLIYCSQCSSTSHPSCLDLSLDMVPHIKKYAWQCPDCKSCARCKENADEDKMLFCDICDRGYHIYCVGLKKVPSGRWQCQECTTVENNSCINNSTPVREVFKEPGILEMQEG